MRWKLGVLGLLIIILLISITYSNDTEVSLEVLNSIEEQTTTSVIVKLEKSPEDLNFVEEMFAADVKMEKIAEDQYVLEINSQDLEQLLEDPNVLRIEQDEIASVFLSTSVPLVNGDDVHIKQFRNINITGIDQSICVIDSGVNSTHPGLNVVAEHCFCDITDLGSGGCCSDNTNEVADGEDDFGHGTHVAGIAASNLTGSVGMAPGARIVSVKVTNSSGSAYFSDITQAIEFCTLNATKYNISVITMSLGGGGYSTFCDADGASNIAVTAQIAAAVAKNITVIAATGNSASKTLIASPACIKDVIAVSSSSDADAVSSYSNRNSLTDIMAPGETITSTATSGSSSCASSSALTKSCSGTSMSAPHVAGAVALLQQYKEMVEGRNLTFGEVNITLTTNGTTIDDSAGSGNLFTRLDIFLALGAIDELYPTITNPNTTFVNNYVYNNISFIVNITDVNINTVWISANWSGSFVNYTMTKKVGNQYNYTIGNNSYSAGQIISWRIYVNDSNNNINFTDLFSTTVLTGAPVITLNAPNNNLITGTKNITFNFSAVDDLNSQFNCSIFLNNAINLTNTTTLNGTITNFAITNLAEGNNTWYIKCNDSSALSSTSSVRTIKIDTIKPLFGSQILSAVLELGDNQYQTIIVNDTNLVYANYSYQGLNETMVNITSANFTHNMTTFLNGTNNYTVYGIDIVGNINNTKGSFIVNDSILGPRLVRLEYSTSLVNNTAHYIQGWLVNDHPISAAILTVGNTNYTMTNNTFYNFTYSYTVNSCGNTNFTIWSNDTLGNVKSNLTSINVTSCCGDSTCSATESCTSCSKDCGACAAAASGGGGGGGGTSAAGGGSAEPSNRVTRIISDASPNNPVNIESISNNLSITQVYIEVNKVLMNLKVTIERLDSNPTISTGKEVFEYYSIYLTNFGDEDIVDSTVNFEVSKNWVLTNNIDKDTIKLLRYTESWDELETSFLSEDSNSYNYEADVPGFSYFAIAGEKYEIPVEEMIAETFDEEVIGEAITEAPEILEGKFSTVEFMIISAVIVLIILGIILFLVHERHEDKS
ncbi:MAG: S8 family serine peptidase [Nanoarchaeota archaeon]|nr:S8 family serine peptidase [Nanoarchaeota archaeon]